MYVPEKKINFKTKSSFGYSPKKQHFLCDKKTVWSYNYYKNNISKLLNFCNEVTLIVFRFLNIKCLYERVQILVQLKLELREREN